ncbi:conserved hypothetical protein [Cupriavidus taiwanensis]|uniref:hypothetical protein n=1 Tax=Cupriavidus taiwanensis TaxID=164546 RepID=UPI000E136007|nr:hypothetical protein [Cupriavidus taiwanensis]SPA23026.1 conserved hypothetical protein [Cupriavidus taiwanensis]
MEQMNLALIGGMCNGVLWFATPKRRATKRAIGLFRPMVQLRLKLYVKKLVRFNKGFVWTRPDGKQFFCKTLRSLAARVMDYDGAMLRGLLKMVKP